MSLEPLELVNLKMICMKKKKKKKTTSYKIMHVCVDTAKSINKVYYHRQEYSYWSTIMESCSNTCLTLNELIGGGGGGGASV